MKEGIYDEKESRGCASSELSAEHLIPNILVPSIVLPKLGIYPTINISMVLFVRFESHHALLVSPALISEICPIEGRFKGSGNLLC